MLRCFKIIFFLLLLIGHAFVVINAEDEADGEVEDETDGSTTEAGEHNKEPVDVSSSKTTEEGEEETAKIGPSPDVQIRHIFIEPEDSKDLPGGKLAKFLFGVQNRGEKDLIFKSCEASFRYLQEYNYRIQNFTTVTYNRILAPRQEASFDYAFYPSEQFAGRPLGLVIEVHYEDSDGTFFISTVFNETVVVTEDESGFNTETGFLYLMFTAVVVLLMLLGQHFLSKLTRKHGITKGRQPQYVEVGSNKNEVDFEWIPREVMKQTKSPKIGSSRQRKTVRIE